MKDKSNFYVATITAASFFSAFIILTVFVPKVWALEGNSSHSSERAISIERGADKSVCASLKDIFLLKDNQEIFKESISGNPFNLEDKHIQGQFIIPEGNINFTYPEWREAAFEEIERIYKDEIYYLVKKISNDQKAPPERVIEKIEMTDLNFEGSKATYYLYRVYFSTMVKNFLFINDHSARFYEDNYSNYFPFYYRGRLLWGGKGSSRYFAVIDLNGPIGKKRELICSFVKDN